MKTKTPPKAAPRRKPRAKPKSPRSGSLSPHTQPQPRTAAGYVREIKAALADGAYLRSRELSAQGTARFPKHVLLARYARVLAPPKVIRSESAPDPTLRVNKEWIKQHGDQYMGKWIALHNGELLGSADALGPLIDTVGKNPKTLFTKIF